ncbi:MAG: hypothetical protein ACXAC7_20050 [Candidatus Hodarchaeales archaeon]|jgi:hypothetical protein
MEIKPKTGLIGFFDILGYQQMLMSNEVEVVAKIIVDVLAKTPKNVVESLSADQGLIVNDNLKAFHFQNEFYQKVFMEEIDWLLFSDSILVSLPIDLNDDLYFSGLRWVAFLNVCAFLLKQMFDIGLPLRGAVSWGDFFIEENYFAGRPIIESYQTSESLELSGCILANSAEEKYKELLKYTRNYESGRIMFKQLCIEHLVPFKREKSDKKCMINWINLPLKFFSDNIPHDVREYVFSSFVAYNKDIPPIVYPKINNTETFIRKILKNVESIPWSAYNEEMDTALQMILKEKNISF